MEFQLPGIIVNDQFIQIWDNAYEPLQGKDGPIGKYMDFRPGKLLPGKHGLFFQALIQERLVVGK